MSLKTLLPSIDDLLPARNPRKARPAIATATPSAAPGPEAALLAEHTALAERLGVPVPHGNVEGFKKFLRENDFTVFSLTEVISYMDARAKEEGNGSGWEWRPLRVKDNLENVSFGTPGTNSLGRLFPASDYYRGPREEMLSGNSGMGETQNFYDAFQNALLIGRGGGGGGLSSISRSTSPASPTPYPHTIPLSALRKVAKIEDEFSSPVAFFVSDYALAPHISVPDPFLLAVIPNPNLAKGTGRFVLDFWDEPGLGIEKMLASDLSDEN